MRLRSNVFGDIRQKLSEESLLTSEPFSRNDGGMKTRGYITAALIGLLTVSLRAGPAVEYKQVAPPPPPLLYGTGFYSGIDLGANLYQNRGDTRTFTDDNPASLTFGETLTFDPKNDVG